jgi:hypothetical protein
MLHTYGHNMRWKFPNLHCLGLTPFQLLDELPKSLLRSSCVVICRMRCNMKNTAHRLKSTSTYSCYKQNENNEIVKKSSSLSTGEHQNCRNNEFLKGIDHLKVHCFHSTKLSTESSLFCKYNQVRTPFFSMKWHWRKAY